MQVEQYITERVDDQISWYDKKSIINQLFYKRIQFMQIVLSSSVVLLVGFQNEQDWIRWVIALFSMFVAISTGLNALYKFHENWTSYRTTVESLRHQKYLFLTGVEPYDKEDSFDVFVGNIEALISKENSNWENYIKTSSKKHA